MRLRLFILFSAFYAAATLGAQAPVIAPTPNLVADGIPPIPASIAADVRRYTESRAANLVDWHPTRRELVISTRFGNAAQLHVVKSPGGARTQLTFSDEPIRPRGISRARGATSCSAATPAATNSASSIATTFTMDGSR